MIKIINNYVGKMLSTRESIQTELQRLNTVGFEKLQYYCDNHKILPDKPLRCLRLITQENYDSYKSTYNSLYKKELKREDLTHRFCLGDTEIPSTFPIACIEFLSPDEKGNLRLKVRFFNSRPRTWFKTNLRNTDLSVSCSSTIFECFQIYTYDSISNTFVLMNDNNFPVGQKAYQPLFGSMISSAEDPNNRFLHLVTKNTPDNQQTIRYGGIIDTDKEIGGEYTPPPHTISCKLSDDKTLYVSYMEDDPSSFTWSCERYDVCPSGPKSFYHPSSSSSAKK